MAALSNSPYEIIQKKSESGHWLALASNFMNIFKHARTWSDKGFPIPTQSGLAFNFNYSTFYHNFWQCTVPDCYSVKKSREVMHTDLRDNLGSQCFLFFFQRNSTGLSDKLQKKQSKRNNVSWLRVQCIYNHNHNYT